MRKGKQSIVLERPVYIECASSVVGKKEGEGPLKEYFDVVIEDEMLGADNWETAESGLQQKAVEKLLDKSKVKTTDISYIFAGDLLGQLIATSFGVKKFEIPLIAVYGACSTFGEAIALGSLTLNNMNSGDRVIALASSHFASAEKQFRFPLGYGNQRPMSSTWTVTGSGAVLLKCVDSQEKKEGLECDEKTDYIGKVCAVTMGKIVDFGVKDSMNMGACMAPAAADLIVANFKDLEVDENYYDAIITGDLGEIGSKILKDLVKEKGYDISSVHEDCGVEIYDAKTQNTCAGGSGCGCSAVTFSGMYVRKMISGELKRVLLVPTGALLSQISFNEGESIPGIAHGVVIEA